MTFDELTQAWLAWRNGVLSTGEFLVRMETFEAGDEPGPAEYVQRWRHEISRAVVR